MSEIIIPDNVTAVFGGLSPGTNKISITIGENVKLDLDEDNPFDMSFYNYYTRSRKGTYKFSGDTWTLEN
ncbi:MAG: hypothetical protein LBL43_04075 [Treponema sp.]|nr:hypothetical protein [Treponema sp.]